MIPRYPAVGLALKLLGAGAVVTDMNGLLGMLAVVVGVVVMAIATSAVVLRRRAERDGATPRDIRLHRSFPLIVLIVGFAALAFILNVLVITTRAPI
jgi:hypothetical protein